ncbi:MAG: DNA primase [Thermoleophilia bacterium]|nr:DNA primase [Thermoleophilia bacterium]
MARISPQSVEEVKAAADMVAVVSGRTQLRKAGARWVGRCPFHEERTPSFSVNPVDKLFHCFGCGKGGDLISFVEETENVDFAGAIEWLADRFRVSLTYEEASPQAERARQRRERLLALLEQAAAFYERHLWDAESGAAARDYLAGRGFGEAVCREFRLGLAPGGRTLVAKAHAKGFSSEELLAAGLANRRGNDYFSGRLLFPLADARGRVVGFQARKLRDDDPLAAKYVNSPESELFRKRDLLYGLHLARGAIAKSGRAVIVEGNPDVIGVRQAGFEPVVAAMGTALTEAQLKALARLARRLVLCFDGDAAGEAATQRGMELAAARGFELAVVALPPGVDPADAADRFEELLTGAEPYAIYRVRTAIEVAPDRNAAYRAAKEVLDRLPESPEREEAWRLANDRLDMTIQVRAAVPSTRAAVTPRLLSASERLERDALAGCLAHRSLLPVLGELGPDHFDVPLHRRACAHLLEPGEPGADLVALLAELDARADAEGIDAETTEQLLLRLRERRLRRELETAEDDRLPDLQQALARVRTAFRELA